PLWTSRSTSLPYTTLFRSVIISITYDGEIDQAALEFADEEEEERVRVAIEELNCEIGAVPVEREGDDLFEVDDAICDAGQYDIKDRKSTRLNSSHVTISYA